MLATVTRNGTEVGRWSAPGFPYEIEIELDVLEEIRHRAEEGYQRIGHGGVEFGGVLYGRIETGLVRILEWRELESDHAAGPSFVLSKADCARLEAMIAQPQRDGLLSGMEAVGWWASHGRSTVALKPQDVEVHEKYFPGAQQVMLILKPARHGPSGAGFFGRNGEGELAAAATEQEFEVRANVTALIRPPRATAAPRQLDAQLRLSTAGLMGGMTASGLAPPRPIGPRRPEGDSGRHAAEETAQPASAPAPAAESTMAVAEPPLDPSGPDPGPAFSGYATPSRGFRWWFLGALLAVAALAGAVALLIPQLIVTEPDSAGLRVEERGNLLVIRWDQTIPRMRFGDEGLVEITDDGPPRTIQLDREELNTGTLTYVRRTGDVKVALRVRSRGRVTLEEFARYLGPAAVKQEQPPSTRGAMSGQLQSDERRVDEALKQEAFRKQRLDESVRILEERLKE